MHFASARVLLAVPYLVVVVVAVVVVVRIY